MTFHAPLRGPGGTTAEGCGYGGANDNQEI
jgi:hypothetical protein